MNSHIDAVKSKHLRKKKKKKKGKLNMIQFGAVLLLEKVGG